MKRVAAIILFMLYLVTATEVRQLLKLPVLFEHYTEHKQNNSGISFLDFIYMHYAGSDFDDDDQDRDMQLPFKSPTTALDIAFTSASSAIILKPAASIKDKLVFLQDVNFKSSDLSSIWQPPKLS